MRNFILFSNRGYTSPNFKNLMKAGRLDIVANSIIHCFFLSNSIRKDVRMSIILNGPPDPPKHIEINYNEKLQISKKDVGELLRIVLWKYKRDKRIEALPGIFIEKKSFEKVIEEISKTSKIYLLEKKGKFIDEINFEKNKDLTFVLGDHEGLPKDKKNFLEKFPIEKISLGNLEYFTSQCIVIINFYLDKNNIW